MRRPPPGALHKEWLHFCVLGGEVEVIANFSLMNETARVALIVRTADGAWHGDIEEIPAEHARIERGAIDLDFGQSSLRFNEHGFAISIALTDQPVTARLELEPKTLPLLRSGPIHWMVVPRLLARGTVIIGSERFELDGAPAYHDHNWGKFAWGDDFAWQWGFGLPSTNDPHAFAFVRLIDRAHTRDLGHALCVWRGAEQQRIFREGELTIRPTGHLKKPRITKLPRTMALLAPERTTDVPERIEIEAKSRGDIVRATFDAEDVVQLLIPNDRDLGLTAINEISGRLHVEGAIDGSRIRVEGRGYFEVLSITAGAPISVAASKARRFVSSPGFAAFLRASFEVLRTEAAAIYAAMCAALEGLVLRITVSGETLTLGFAKSEAIECTGDVHLDVELATDARTILELCDASLTLAQAVRTDRVHLRGHSSNLITFDDGLAIYLAGAARTPSFPALLHDYRADTERSRT